MAARRCGHGGGGGVTTTRYPPELSGIEFLWLALDGKDRVGAFVTAGCAPIPAAVLAQEGVAFWEHRILELAVRSEPGWLRYAQDSASRDLALRGVFAYDGEDYLNKPSHKARFYRLCAAPVTPVTAAALPPDLLRAASLVRFPELVFGDTENINLVSLCPCVDSDDAAP